jgi:CRISPR-associated RAMP protein (TIGR02581 family)
VEAILRTKDERLACLCVTEEEGHPCPTTRSRKKVEGEDSPYEALLNGEFGGDESAMYLQGSCRVCRVFGSPGLASKVQIPDLTLAEEWLGRYQLRYGVSIDRDTETAAEGRLYTSEAVPAGTAFQCEVIVENGSAADQGLVLLGLKAFERGLVTLGGAGSRGLGQVELVITECREIGADPARLIDFLVTGRGVSVDEAGREVRIKSLRQEIGV